MKIGLSAIFVLFAGVVSAEEYLMAHWRFDDGAGNLVSDSSGNGNTGTSREITWVKGVINLAGQLGKVGATVGHDESLNPGKELTIQAWVSPWKQYEQFPTLVRKLGSYSLRFSSGESVGLVLWLDGKRQTFESKPLEFPSGEWQHVAATYDGSKVCIYVNGALDSTHPVQQGGSISSNTSDCYLGAVNGNSVFSGTLDEIRIHSRALSSRDIAQSFCRGDYELARHSGRFNDIFEKVQKRSTQPLVPGILWIDAEDFDEYGGWWMDTQFVPQMGSPYLIAAGVGNPVENAKTTIKVPEAGTYRLWVRNKNWLAKGHAPGQFAVSIGGRKSQAVFGTGEKRAWIWQDGGAFELDKGNATIELEDMSGWYGRCDALILSKDLNFIPKQEQKDYLAERGRLVGTFPVKEMGHYDFIVVGAGVAGCNAAISAARGGAKVALIQDRPMIGGNNSYELGVPVSGGAFSGRGRETGLNEEVGRIRSFNHLRKWSAAAELVIAREPNITVFLNSHVFEAEVDKNRRIQAVKAFNMIDGHQTRYTADLFADCTGDGWLGYYAGAEVMFGRESKKKFGEKSGQNVADNITMSGTLITTTALGYSAVDTGEPVKFTAPKWVYDLRENGEAYEERQEYQYTYKGGTWWVENHGRNDDLWDPEWTRDDLLRVSLSYFNWMKNHSSLADKAANYKLRMIPITNGKRETRRLVGDHILLEQEVVESKVFPDRVGHTSWMIDIHHPEGIFSKGSPFDSSKQKLIPASIPFRILYSRDVPNMLMAGRCVSVTHLTLGTTRVQGTTGMMGQIVGTAAALCKKHKTNPRGIYKSHIEELQQQLLKDDLSIPHLRNEDPDDLALMAGVTASSSTSIIDGPNNVINGLVRPMNDSMSEWFIRAPKNMWISDPNQPMPQWIELDFGRAKKISMVQLTFDTNLEVKHQENKRLPQELVRDYQVQVETDAGWKTVADVKHNYQRRRIHRFDPVKTAKIRVLITATHGDTSARIFEVRAYDE